MKICVAHLSDVHIKTADDLIVRRAQQIADAINATCLNPDATLLAFTGDIAFSGKAAQYAVASGFIADIKKRCGSPNVIDFYIAGNHDLNFDRQPDTRPLLLDSIPEKIQDIDLKGDIIKQMLSVQSEFFAFESHITGKGLDQRLFRTLKWTVNGKVLKVNCLNTAWVSENPEIVGKLVFPLHAINDDLEPSELTISALHHPYNWLAPENKRRLQELVESLSDIVLTGHEHESQVYSRETGTGITHYVEGAVLQEHASEYSAFNCLVVDTEAKEFRHDLCVWDRSSYMRREGDWRPFVRTRLLHRAAFRHTDDFKAKLLDIGMPISHPVKKPVELADLYIYPSINVRGPNQTTKTLTSDQVSGYFQDSSKVLVVGEELSGKTALTKMLAQDMLSQSGDVVLLLKGHQFESFREGKIRTLLKTSIAEQYGTDAVEPYLQLTKDDRVLIIDDWDKIDYGTKGQAAIMSVLRGFFDRIFCFANSIYPLEQLAEGSALRETFADFDTASINAFGRVLIGRLAEKWHSTGREYTLDSITFERDVAFSEELMRSVAEKEMLPTYPWFLISMLGATRERSSITNAGAYGHVFEALITIQLSSAFPSKPAQIATLYKYLSRLAYFLFGKNRPIASHEEMRQLHDAYNSDFGLTLDFKQIISSLVEGRVLAEQGDSISFRYKWTYYFFVALYLAENGDKDPKIEKKIHDITDHLSTDEYTNVLMLYLYKTKNEAVLNRLLDKAALIYAEYEPCNLDSHVEFVNKLITERAKPIALPTTSVRQNIEAERKAVDDADEIEKEPSPTEVVAYSPTLNELLKLMIAFQHLRVIGQVLKNFPGVLEKSRKFRLAEASYLLGLRIMNRILALAKDNLEELRQHFGLIARERYPDATSQEIERGADETLIWLTTGACHGMIKRVSRAIGLEDLQPTFDEVLRQHGERVSVQLIDLAIKLDHFENPPEAQIFDVEEALRKNHFSHSILRKLVYENLMLRTSDGRVMQRMGALFDIKISRPQFLLNKPPRIPKE